MNSRRFFTSSNQNMSTTLPIPSFGFLQKQDLSFSKPKQKKTKEKSYLFLSPVFKI